MVVPPVARPLTYRPPPLLLAELPLTVQLVSVSVPPKVGRPPPPPKPPVAELPLTVQSVSVAVPRLSRPPPLLRRSCR